MMKKLIAKTMNLVNNAKEIAKSEEAQEVACHTIATVGIMVQLNCAKKFYSAMIPAIKAEHNKALKIYYVALVLLMTFCYAYNIRFTLKCCEPSKNLDDLEEVSDEDFDEIEKF